MPPADQAHGLLSVQLLIALLQMDMKILSRGRVIVIHVKGDLEVDAADGLHQPAHRLPLDDHIEVRGDTSEFSHLFFQGGNAVDQLGIRVPALIEVVHRVQAVAAALAAGVDHGIPGQAHAMDRLCLAVKGEQQHGVSIAAPGGVLPHQKEGVYSGLPAASGHFWQLGPVKIRGAVPLGGPGPAGGVRDLRQLHPHLQSQPHPDHQDG